MWCVRALITTFRMDEAQRFKVLSELFERARDLARPELEAFLAGLTDRSLRDELAAMIELDREGTVGVGPLVDIASVLDAEQESTELPVPDRVGNYDIIGVIGHGASGVVLKARQPETDRIVAIKVLGTGSWNPNALARFRREVRLLGRLDHPNIARVYEAGTDAASLPVRPYFVMEYVEGKTLVTWAKELAEGESERAIHARLARILDVFEQIVLAVGYAHANGVVHRDLKPANILVSSNGRAKVLDFGVSGVLPESSASAFDDTRVDTPTQSLPGHAATDQLVGTVPYMSPEQFDGGKAVERRSDLYSIGVMLYECLAGELPYAIDRASIPTAAATIRTIVPQSLARVHAAYAGGIEAVVAKLLEKDPKDRYQSATELLEDLRRVRDGRSTNARPLTVIDRARRSFRSGAWRRRALRVSVPVLVTSILVVSVLVLSILAALVYSVDGWRAAEARIEALERQLAPAVSNPAAKDPDAEQSEKTPSVRLDGAPKGH